MILIPPDLLSTPDGMLSLSFAVFSPVFFLLEWSETLQFGYSKFVDKSAIDVESLKMPSRIGMFIIYFPAALAYPLLTLYLRGSLTHPSCNSFYHHACMMMITSHFVKRVLEVLFLHKYSGCIGGVSVALISTLYTVVAGLPCVLATLRMPIGSQPQIGASQIAGFLIWVLGSYGNFFHHDLLAKLRKDGEKGYKVPKGGLFGLVCCPHYFCEIIAWFGFSLFFTHIGAFCLTLTMAMYLLGRAPATLAWYKQKQLKIPPDWKSMVPYLW
jgi:very-long-chain enoyl-CoA reductase